MKKILSLFILVLILQSCNETDLKNGGQFYAENNNLFYGIYINSEMDSIKIYMVEKWSSNILNKNIKEKQNYEFSVNGSIKLKENEIFITELESDLLPSKRPKLKSLKIRNGKIYVDCNNLTEYIWGRIDLDNCATELIKFSRMEK